MDVSRPADSRVITAYGAKCLIETAAGELLVCKSRRKAGRPVCGDRVRLDRHDGGEPSIETIEARRNCFSRADRKRRKRIVAANLDLIVIVVAPRPPPTRDLINSYLVAARNVAIEAAICVNKSDLIEADGRDWDALSRLYRRLGYPVCRSSNREGDGLSALERLLADQVSILVGQSGVGKSSLINRLVPDLDLRTCELSAATGKGRHTTTTTTLYPLAGGGEVVDSPGVWEYGIWNMSNAEIAYGFREFDRYSGRCRFADCEHLVEPGCAVEAAAQSGEIEPARVRSYRRIVAANRRQGR